MTPSWLMEAVGRVDVIDAAGRIIANPYRHGPSAPTADIVALAFATETFWAVAVEAEVLVRALQRPITGNDEQDAARDAAIQEQSDTISKLMAAIRGGRDETDGNRN